MFTDLTNKNPQEWDYEITNELTEAGINIHKFREYNSPHYWVEHTLTGKLGDWVFSRDTTTYSFWGDVPLATAEVIANDQECLNGCVPLQWFDGWKNKPIPPEVNLDVSRYVSWIDKNGMFRVKDEGYSEGYKEAQNSDFSWKLLFVDDPSKDGKPFITTYTFFTQKAMNNFVSICKKHRVSFAKTR